MQLFSMAFDEGDCVFKFKRCLFEYNGRHFMLYPGNENYYIDNELDKDVLWKIYSQGALRKSIDWMFQNEWRLLLPIGKNNYNEFNVEFFPITKVFLGNRMEPSKRKEIIDYCKSKNISYVGMRRNPNVFEMEECPLSCDQCMICKA